MNLKVVALFPLFLTFVLSPCHSTEIEESSPDEPEQDNGDNEDNEDKSKSTESTEIHSDPGLDHNQPCDDFDNNCSSLKGLICTSGICLCNETISTFNTSLGICVGKPDHPCIMETCVPNACCRAPEDICRCGSAFIQSPSGHCVVDHGASCAAYPLTPCLEGLKCKNGKCVCKYENHQYYDQDIKKCVSYVGGPCTTNTDTNGNGHPDADGDGPDPENGGQSDLNDLDVNTTIPCVKHASCKSEGHGAYNCICDPDFVESPERTCDIKFGRKCSTDAPSPVETNSNGFPVIEFGQNKLPKWDNEVEHCDRFTPLSCINGVCACDDELKIYDKQAMKCRGLVGAICQASQPDCIRGAVCEPRGRFRDGQGICKCMASCEFVQENRSCANCLYGVYHG